MKKVLLFLLLCTILQTASAQRPNTDSLAKVMYDQYQASDFEGCLKTCTFVIDVVKTNNPYIYTERALCYYNLTPKAQDQQELIELYQGAIADFDMAKSTDHLLVEYMNLYNRCKTYIQSTQ